VEVGAVEVPFPGRFEASEVVAVAVVTTGGLDSGISVAVVFVVKVESP